MTLYGTLRRPAACDSHPSVNPFKRNCKFTASEGVTILLKDFQVFSKNWKYYNFITDILGQ